MKYNALIFKNIIYEYSCLSRKYKKEGEYDMELQTLMRNPKVSTREKHNAVKKHALDILKEVMECIEKEDYDAVEQYWSYSAAGDGYGDDNCFIDFNFHCE